MKAVTKSLMAGTAALFIASPVSINNAGAVPTDAIPHGASVPSEATSTCWTWRAEEKGFMSRVNYERRRRGIAPLYWDRHLGRVSRKHTNDMVYRQSLYHTASRTLGWRVTNWSILGENVGVGGTVPVLHAAFMASPSHRANVLYSRFRYMGVGTRYDSRGTLWVTATFEASRNPGTRLSMPPC